MLDSDRVLEKAAALKAQGRPFALATVVRCESPVSAKPGAKAIVEPSGAIDGWIGGGCAQPVVIKMARRSIEEQTPFLIRVSPTADTDLEQGIVGFGMTCHSGGTLEIFIEPVLPRPGLLIVGISPAARTLGALAARVGFAVVGAAAGAQADFFPDAEQVIDGFDLQALKRPVQFAVVATQGKGDEEGLEAALRSGAPYIALVASDRKAGKLRSYLKERGHDAGKVAAIVAPAGVEIGALSPEEVALSVLAGVVKERRENTPAAAAGSARADPQPSAGAGGAALDPVCGMSVDTDASPHRASHGGRTYYFCCAHCLHSFEKEPGRYLGSQGPPS